MNHKKLIFALFFVSGFCGLVYQVVWLRLAYASFGINSQIMSVVLSTFMAGLAIGSWSMGKLSHRLKSAQSSLGLEIYALLEVGIGISAFVVPMGFKYGEKILLQTGQIDSLAYFVVSALILVVVLLPWCVLMGATIPLMMENIKRSFSDKFSNERTFSYLYLANTAGATFGVILTAVMLIEVFGFSMTLFIGATLNAFIAFSILYASRTLPEFPETLIQKIKEKFEIPQKIKPLSLEHRMFFVILFTTGAFSMALEVIWIRWFTPLLSTTIYAFAYILALYLIGTCVGLWHYKHHAHRGKTWSISGLLVLVVWVVFLQLIVNDPNLYAFTNGTGVSLLSDGSTFSIYLTRFFGRFGGMMGLTGVVFVFAYLLGYLTPKQVDELSENDPRIAGKAYAVNVLGCIVGPLIASYLLLPYYGVKVSVLLLNFLLVVVVLAYLWRIWKIKRISRFVGGIVLVTVFIVLFTTTYEDGPHTDTKQVRRDSMATVIALGDGTNKQMLVNGVGITSMTPVTKTMAHLPIVFLKNPPKKVLDICFGMGTTFRSSLSWGVDTTGVDLSSAVIEEFNYFFSDTENILKNPKAHLVVDDGRRFLLRTRDNFDVITIDPPPPITAAGSSLLYSKDFYTVLKGRLASGGILQQWYPYLKGQSDQTALLAVTHAITESFPYVVMFPSVEGWGYHFLASEKPIQNLDPKQFADRLTPEATRDLLEWTPELTAEQFAGRILPHRIDMSSTTADSIPTSINITDDNPYNEYYLLRSFLF
jgi:predicted membrane-bound spermidine synthase